MLMNWILKNYANIIVITVLLSIGVIAIKILIKNKGKCSSCKYADTCVIKKVIKHE